MFFSKFKKTGAVNLVHSNDLMAVLIKLNILSKINEGKIKCKFTKKKITIDNLHAVFYENNDIKAVSNSVEAIKQFSAYLNEKTL